MCIDKYRQKGKANFMLITQKKNKKTEQVLNIRIDEETFKALKANAEKFTDGNLSAWLKYAGTYCKPLKKHILKKEK